MSTMTSFTVDTIPVMTSMMVFAMMSNSVFSVVTFVQIFCLLEFSKRDNLQLTSVLSVMTIGSGMSSMGSVTTTAMSVVTRGVGSQILKEVFVLLGHFDLNRCLRESE